MTFLPAEIIKKKRMALELSEPEIKFFIDGYTSGQIPDYQMSALLMAIFFQGMSSSETFALTKCMLNSGVVVKFPSHSLRVDKHSTGGVGDKTSLILGPIVAAAGVPVPMISGRGLGHTGGTLDKLESIPGFNVRLSLTDFIKHVEESKICFIGQTQEICPADKKIYALRDVTATVESLPLICASIMSKKLAEGIDGLVLDVKFGSGAFMKDPKKSEELALALKKIAESYGKKCVALLTNMNQPLGRYSGNSLEVYECLEIMKGSSFVGPDGYDLYADTRELSLWLSAHMITLGGRASNAEEGYQIAKQVLASGKALEMFYKLCEIHGGNVHALPMPKQFKEVKSSSEGYLSDLETEKIGIAGILLRAGRMTTADQIHPTSGIEFHKKIGDSVLAGEKIFTIWGDEPELFSKADEILKSSFKISLQKGPAQDLILKTLL